MTITKTPSSPNWTTSVSETQQRLEQLGEVLEKAKRPDGSIDLKAAKALAGTDVQLSRLVNQIRVDDYVSFSELSLSSELTPDQARTQFAELQKAIALAASADKNGDRGLGYEEIPYSVSGETAEKLVLHAAMPADMDGTRPAPRNALSLEVRQEAERYITELANHHAATPLGAEALKWDMRWRLAAGAEATEHSVSATVEFAEFSWERHLPDFLGGREAREGKGHLSDEELSRFLGMPLPEFIEKQKQEVNAQLLMDYETEFLAGKDLPRE